MRERHRGVMCAAALLVLLAASSATAQGVLSFDRLGAEVAPGHAVTVDTVDASVQGAVKALDAGMLVLVLDGGGERGYPASEVRRVRVRDRLADGVLWGTAAGLVVGGLVGRLTYGLCMGDRASGAECLPSLALPTIAGGAVGALLGVLFDDACQRTIDIAPSTTVRATPWGTRGGGGLAVRVAF